ncbi:hypothetical protein [Nocardia thailandica]|uniref:Uncharacterized protein n=1 Tax=Nocardia thailandica TaxID=257275 RepID=A0ABW6PTF3_9NOCA
MTDPAAAQPLDAVPDADAAEQAQSVYQDADPDDPAFGDAGPTGDAALAEAVSRDEWSADPADVVEQHREVPLDDRDDYSTSA